MESESRRTSIAKYLDAFTGLVGIIVFANVLGASGLGLYYILAALNRIGNRPAAGIATAAEHFVSSENADGTYISTSVIIGFLASLFVVVLTFGSYNLIPGLDQFEIPTAEFYALLILIVCSSLFQLSRGAYSGSGYPSSATFVNAARGVIETTIQVVVVIQGGGVAGMLLGTAVSAIIGFVYMMLNDRVDISSPSKWKAIQILLYARWSILTRIIDALYKRIDTIVIGLIISPAATGIYSATKRIVQPVGIIGFGIKRPMIVSVSQYDGVPDELSDKLDSLGGYAAILGIPLLFGGILVGKDLLGLIYGAEFIEGYPILVASAIYFSFLSHNAVLSEFIHGVKKPEIVSISTLVSLIFRVLTSVALVLMFGLYGIIPAMIIAPILRFAYLSYHVEKQTGRYYKPYRVKYQLMASIVMFGVVFPFSLLDKSPVVTIGSVVLGGIVYCVVLVYLDSSLKSEITSIYNSFVESK